MTVFIFILESQVSETTVEVDARVSGGGTVCCWRVSWVRGGEYARLTPFVFSFPFDGLTNIVIALRGLFLFFLPALVLCFLPGSNMIGSIGVKVYAIDLVTDHSLIAFSSLLLRNPRFHDAAKSW